MFRFQRPHNREHAIHHAQAENRENDRQHARCMPIDDGIKVLAAPACTSARLQRTLELCVYGELTAINSTAPLSKIVLHLRILVLDYP